MSKLADVSGKLKTGWKGLNIWVKILIFAFIILLGWLFIQHLTINSLQKKNQLQAVELMLNKDSVQAYKTRAGEAYFKINAVQVESNALKGSLIEAGFTIKDLRQKDIKWQDLVGVLTAKIESFGSGSTAGHDTTIYITNSTPFIGKKYNDWNNGNLFLYGLYTDKDSLHHKYKYQTGISLFPEKQGKNTKVTATLTDTHATITTGYSIIVDNKTKWFMKPWLWGLAGVAGGFFLFK